MRGSDLSEALARSLHRQELLHRSSLILNPVENLPFEFDLAPAAGFLHGLYNSDKMRRPAQQKDTDHQFAGRRRLAYDSRRIYAAFAEALGASDVSLRLLSGLNAHAVLFMALATQGQSVLLLPERAGGHMSTKGILERLGLRVIDMVVDDSQHCIDIDATVRQAASDHPDFIFVDRSEGLVFEDFSELTARIPSTSIFDASQYLTNIMSGDHPNPFSMGFRYMLATLHKNFPGPQKALIATREPSEEWNRILSGVSTFVSNMHVFSTYSAGLALGREEDLRRYSRGMLDVTTALDTALRNVGVDAVDRPKNRPTTHHIWIRAQDRDQAFAMFQALERCRILVNYRRLPYGIGHGLRLGVNSAVRLGMIASDADTLAMLIGQIVREGSTSKHRHDARLFISDLWSRHDADRK